MKKIITKKEDKQIQEIANEMSKYIGKIDKLNHKFREIVGYKYTEVSFFEDDDIVWSDDSKELADSMVQSCIKSRCEWGIEELKEQLEEFKNYKW